MSLSAQSAPLLRGVLTVKNREPNATVFSKQVNGDPLRVTFAAAGHEGDTQRVPVALAEDIDFLNALENGVLEVTGGPQDLVEALQFETERARKAREAEASKVSEVLDRRQDRDILGQTCIGPAPTGREGSCNRPLIQSAKQQGEVPPLCSQHIHLAPNFYLAEAGSKGEGATETRDGVVRREWRQVEVDRRRSV